MTEDMAGIINSICRVILDRANNKAAEDDKSDCEIPSNCSA